MKKLPHIFDQNESWAKRIERDDRGFFERLSALQRPQYLWIGCADSRVPANQITGLLPGEVFVHRNVANLVNFNDLNCLSVLQYAVDILEVKHVIVCGHYGCGGVTSAWNNQRLGLISQWLEPIRRLADERASELQPLQHSNLQIDRLCELNVIEQARNVCQTKTVREAWARGAELSVHGWIYHLENGRLRDLDFCVSSAAEIPD